MDVKRFISQRGEKEGEKKNEGNKMIHLSLLKLKFYPFSAMPRSRSRSRSPAGSGNGGGGISDDQRKFTLHVRNISTRMKYVFGSFIFTV